MQCPSDTERWVWVCVCDVWLLSVLRTKSAVANEWRDRLEGEVERDGENRKGWKI